MKYIIVTVSPKGRKDIVCYRYPVIFPNNMVHSDVFESLLFSEMSDTMDIELYSAGDIDFHGVKCHGKSESLNSTSKNGDAKLISTVDYLHGMGEFEDSPEGDAIDKLIRAEEIMAMIKSMQGGA